MLVCPKCKKQFDNGMSFCDDCGTGLIENNDSSNFGKDSILEKMKSFLNLRIAIIAGMLAVIFLAIVIITAFSVGNKANYALYIKDKQIFYSDFSDNSLQVTTRFLNGLDDISDSEMAYLNSGISQYCKLSEDGKTLFFPDKIGESEGISLYYRFVNKPKTESVKIASEIKSYSVNKKATLVTYLKGEDDVLYQYNVTEDKAEKIASQVEEYIVSDDGKIIYFINNDAGLYVQQVDDDKEKIDSDVDEIYYVDESGKNIYYAKEDSLYVKNLSKDKVKIASDIHSVVKIYDSGEIYFLKSDKLEISLMNYIYDDMKDDDATMTSPEEPSKPYWENFHTETEYQDAMLQFEADYAKYLEDVEKYREKLVRDEIRSQLIDQVYEESIYKLCFYDGKEIVNVEDGFMNAVTYAADAPVIIFQRFEQKTSEKLKLSKMNDISNFSTLIKSVISSSVKSYIAIGSKCSLLEHNDAKSFNISSKGDVVYYIDDINEKDEGILYQLKIRNEEIGTAEMYDSDVFASEIYLLVDGRISYYKDVDGFDGSLYVDKNKVDYDVRRGTLRYIEETKAIVYFTDWDEKNYYGTLKIYHKKNAEKIGNDIHSFELSSNGDVLYLSDFSKTYNKGDLYIYRKGKAEKIDTDVSTIISTYQKD